MNLNVSGFPINKNNLQFLNFQSFKVNFQNLILFIIIILIKSHFDVKNYFIILNNPFYKIFILAQNVLTLHVIIHNLILLI